MPWIMDKYGGRSPHISTDAIDPETKAPWPDVVGLKQAVEMARVFHGDDKPLEVRDLPSSFIVEKPRRAFPDMWHAQDNLLIVSDAFRSIVEAHDPGAHHIWPVIMMTKRGERYPGPFFGFVPTTHAAAISEQHSKVLISEERLNPATPIMPEYVSPRTVRLLGRENGCVYPSKLPTAHIWWDHGLTDNYLLISDDMYAAIKNANLKTLHFERLSTVPENDET